MEQKVIDKVKKLLALASDGEKSEAESQTAMLHAQKLMMKHKLSENDLQNGQESLEKDIIYSEFGMREKTWYSAKLANIVADNFRCFYYFMYKNGDKKYANLTFFGYEEDVNIAVEVYEYAFNSLFYHRDVYVEKYKNESMFTPKLSHLEDVGNDFIVGYLDGLKAKFDEQIASNQWEVLLIKDGDLVKAHKDWQKQFNKIKSKSEQVGRAYNEGAYKNGYEKGKSLNNANKLLN